jgi:hypothetical protein
MRADKGNVRVLCFGVVEKARSVGVGDVAVLAFILIVAMMSYNMSGQTMGSESVEGAKCPQMDMG